MNLQLSKDSTYFHPYTAGPQWYSWHASYESFSLTTRHPGPNVIKRKWYLPTAEEGKLSFLPLLLRIEGKGDRYKRNSKKALQCPKKLGMSISETA
ncbi:hypothetical protein TNCV_1966001 [Trichonephila clavipes]|nr:hypothetical protein TNCV_1966001 [Trichonephila clavipes]